MKHRCDEYIKLGLKCPGRHPWEEEECDEDDEDCDDEEGERPLPPDIPFHMLLPERNRALADNELTGLGQLAAEAFLMEWGASVPWTRELPKAAIDYSPFPGYYLPDPFGDRHVDYPTEPAFRFGDPDPTVLVQGRYYTGDFGYAAELFAIAAAAALALSGAYVFTSGAFQNLSSYMMARYINAPQPALAGQPGSGYFYEAPRWNDTPGDFYDKYTADVVVGDQPAAWYGGSTPYTQ